MTGIVGAQPPVDYTAIESRIRREKVDANEAKLPAINARYDAALSEFNKQLALNEKARNHDDTVAFFKSAGVTVGGGAALGAVIGAFAGKGGERLATAGIGAVLGGIGIPVVVGVMSLFGGGASDAFGFRKPTEQSDAYKAADTEFRAAADAKTLADAEIKGYGPIKPGQSWLKVPGAQDTAALKAWTERVFEAHDHDHDGSINIATPTAMTPANEYFRNREGGPVASNREAAVPMTATYELGIKRLESYDTDHSRTVSREELAEGMVKDSGLGYGGLYWNTRDRRDY